MGHSVFLNEPARVCVSIMAEVSTKKLKKLVTFPGFTGSSAILLKTGVVMTSLVTTIWSSDDQVLVTT